MLEMSARSPRVLDVTGREVIVQSQAVTSAVPAACRDDFCISAVPVHTLLLREQNGNVAA